MMSCCQSNHTFKRVSTSSGHTFVLFHHTKDSLESPTHATHTQASTERTISNEIKPNQDQLIISNQIRTNVVK
jgi:hypothetical protein